MVVLDKARITELFWPFDRPLICDILLLLEAKADGLIWHFERLGEYSAKLVIGWLWMPSMVKQVLALPF